MIWCKVTRLERFDKVEFRRILPYFAIDEINWSMQCHPSSEHALATLFPRLSWPRTGYGPIEMLYVRSSSHPSTTVDADVIEWLPSLSAIRT